MQKISNYWSNIQYARPIFGSDFGVFLFLLARKLKIGKNYAFRFQWEKIPFRARVKDFYGSIDDVFLEHEYDVIVPILKNKNGIPLIIDAGANVGAFSIYALSIRRDAIIHSLEAASETYNLLAYNAQVRIPSQWHTHHLALWKEDGHVTFANNTQSSGSHITNSNDKVAPSVEEVPAISLGTLFDKFVSKQITLLKIDIEGAEELVLENAQHLLERVDNMIIEIHTEQVNEARVMEMISRHFPYVHNMHQGDTHFPVIFASRVYQTLPHLKPQDK